MDPKRDVKCKIGKILPPEWSVEEVVVWAQNSLPVRVRTLYGKVEQFLSGVAIACEVPTFGKDEALRREADIMQNKDQLYKVCAVEILEQGMVLYVAGRESELVRSGGYGKIKISWTEYTSVFVECIVSKLDRALELKESIFYSRASGQGTAGLQEIIMTYNEKDGYEIVRRCPKLAGGYIDPMQLLQQQFAPRNVIAFLG